MTPIPPDHSRDAPPHPNIIAFPNPHRRPELLATPRPAAPSNPQPPTAALDGTDLAILHRWMQTAPHGYGRLHVEQGPGASGASFALLYPPGSPWSSYGLARSDGHIELWSCADGRTLGHFPSMATALAAVPRAPARRAPDRHTVNPCARR